MKNNKNIISAILVFTLVAAGIYSCSDEYLDETDNYNIDSQGYLHDIDSSGTFDLIMFPLRVNTSGEIEIYTSNRNISD